MHGNDFAKEGLMFQLDVSNIVKIRSVITIEMKRNVPMYIDE